MARFPYKPGAGAKAIRNPIYWNRLYLQQSRSRRSGQPHRRYSEDAHLTARWLNVNTNLNFFLCQWLKPVRDIEDKLTTKESKSLNDAFETAIEFRDAIASSWDYMSQTNLNKFVTRIKRLFLLVFKLTIKYDSYSKDEKRLLTYTYDSEKKDFILIYADLSVDRTYFMGGPDVGQITEIRQLYRESSDLISKVFRKKTPARKKKPPAKKGKAERKIKPSAASRAKGVVEEISETGIVVFKRVDCVNREAVVRRRMKLHLKVAFQPHLKEGITPDFSEKIDAIISHALDLDYEDSIKLPISHDDEKLIVFEFKR